MLSPILISGPAGLVWPGSFLFITFNQHLYGDGRGIVLLRAFLQLQRPIELGRSAQGVDPNCRLVLIVHWLFPPDVLGERSGDVVSESPHKGMGYGY
jgi:hypothetical protein